MKDNLLILGAGITGLSAGLSLGKEIYEEKDMPGGICASYYVNSKGKRFFSSSDDEERYRFEIGGGHWIFGADQKILNFIASLTKVKSYERNSAVYFHDKDLYVPYPLQNHLSYLPKEITQKAVEEITDPRQRRVRTFADWLLACFGKSLCELFFFPFHQLYTAGLYNKIAPQDQHKSPVNKGLILQGLKEKTPSVGYNATFIYPKDGLDALIKKMEKKCKVNYGKKAVKINLKKKELIFNDGKGIKYENIISTLPLNMMAKISGINKDELPIPYTSVLVVNIGAKRGIKCPDYHWLYIPRSKSGFHRVGFYSNVDSSFLPKKAETQQGLVSIYVEKAFLGGAKPTNEEIRKLSSNIIEELRGWKFISEVEVIDPTWVEIAYTWEFPNLEWKQETIERLEKEHIYQIGRYGKWKFQGIAESMKDGFNIKRDLKLI